MLSSADYCRSHSSASRRDYTDYTATVKPPEVKSDENGASIAPEKTEDAKRFKWLSTDQTERQNLQVVISSDSQPLFHTHHFTTDDDLLIKPFIIFFFISISLFGTSSTSSTSTKMMEAMIWHDAELQSDQVTISLNSLNLWPSGLEFVGFLSFPTPTLSSKPPQTIQLN